MDPDPRFFALVHILAGVAARLNPYAPRELRVDVLNPQHLAELGEIGRAHLAARHGAYVAATARCACALCGGSAVAGSAQYCGYCRQRGCAH